MDELETLKCGSQEQNKSSAASNVKIRPHKDTKRRKKVEDFHVKDFHSSSEITKKTMKTQEK